MHQKKIVQVLKSFSKKEWRLCTRYLNGTLNNNTTELQLFELIKKCKDRFKDHPSSLEMSKVQSKIYPKLNRKELLNLMSRLTNHIEEFLLIEKLASKEYEFEREMMLAKLYRDKGLNKYFEGVIKRAQSIANNLKHYELNYARRQYDVNHTLNFSKLSNTPSKVEAIKFANEYGSRYCANVNHFYALEIKNNRKNYKALTESFQIDVSDELGVLLRELNNLVDKIDPTSYTHLKKRLFDHYKQMSKEIAEVVILHLINYLIGMCKTGQLSILTELAKLYKFGLEKEILLNQKKMSEIQFLNIIDVVSKVELYNNPIKFIGKWVPFVETNNQNTICNLAFAIWHFTNEEYEEALCFINDPINIYNKLNITLRCKWIRICSFYSLYPKYKKYKTLLHTDRKYFNDKRNNVSEATYRGSMSLLMIIQFLWENVDNNDIVSYLENCEHISNQFWIRRQLKIKKMPDDHS